MSVANAGFERTWRTARNLNNVFPFAFALSAFSPSPSKALREYARATVERWHDGTSKDLSQEGGRELLWNETQRAVRRHCCKQIPKADTRYGKVCRLVRKRPSSFGKRLALPSATRSPG